MPKYKCKHCEQILERDLDQAWIKSYCEESGKTVHLMRIEQNDCELKKCTSDLPGIIRVQENIDDGSWATMICLECAMELGLEEGDNLPEVDPR